VRVIALYQADKPATEERGAARVDGHDVEHDLAGSKAAMFGGRSAICSDHALQAFHSGRALVLVAPCEP
jgi:hypothetical protein